MKKLSFKIFLISFFLVAIDLAILFLQHQIFANTLNEAFLIALGLLLVLLIFLVAPFLELKYDESVKENARRIIPKKRADLLTKLSQTLHNEYYTESFKQKKTITKNSSQ